MKAGDVVLDVYIDVVFFLNFFMDFLLLELLRRILKKPVSWKRLTAGAAVGGLTGCVQAAAWSFPPWFMTVVSLAGAGLMVTAAFGRAKPGELAKETGGLYLLAVAAGGIMELLCRYTTGGFYLVSVLHGHAEYAMPLVIWILLALGTCFLAGGLWQFGEELLKERSSRYPVVLSDRDVRVETTGYLDTGNCLRETKSGQGVQIVADRIWRRFEGSKGERAMIPYHTVGNPYGVMEGLRIERIEVRQTKTGMTGQTGTIRLEHPWIARAPYGLTRDGSYEVLLHKEALMASQRTEAGQTGQKGGITDGN